MLVGHTIFGVQLEIIWETLNSRTFPRSHEASSTSKNGGLGDRHQSREIRRWLDAKTRRPQLHDGIPNVGIFYLTCLPFKHGFGTREVFQLVGPLEPSIDKASVFIIKVIILDDKGLLPFG